MRKGNYILTLLLLFFSILLTAQSGMKIEHLTEEDGLPHRNVNQIIQDKNGFLWLATSRGICRYDGHEFKSIPITENKNMVRNVITLQESNDGMIWLKPEGTDIPGILNPYTLEYKLAEKGKDFFVPNQEKSEVVYFHFARYLKDFPTPNIALDQKRDKKDYTRLLHGEKIFGNETILTMEGEKEIWFWHNRSQDGTKKPPSQDYTRYDIVQKKLEFFDLPSHLNITFANPFLPIDTEGRFWFPSSEKNSKALFDYFLLPDGLPLAKWFGTRVDNKGNIWIYNRDFELFRFDLKQNQLERIGKMENKRMEVYEDEQGTLWIGTENGLRKIRRKRNLFETYIDEPVILGESPPFGKSLYQIIEPTPGHIITRTRGRGFYQVDSQNKKTDFVNLLSGTIFPTQNDYFYYLINREILKKVKTPLLQIQDLEFNRNAPNYSGNLKDKIVAFEEREKKFYFIDTLTNRIEISEKYEEKELKYFFVDTAQKILWANHEKGIIRVNVEEISDEYIELWGEENLNFIRSWLPVRDSLWLGTLEGLKLLDLKSKKIIQNYTVNDGLPHNTIYSILQVDDNLWLGTHNGLCSFNPQTSKVRNFYVEDGLTHNEFNSQSALLASDGRIWMGGLNGLNVFQPEELLKTKPDSADLLLTSFSKYNIQKDSFYLIEDVLELLDKKKYTILPSDQSFTFQFFINIFSEPSKHQYYWYLDGYETEWANVDNEPIARYQNVPPGNYILRIKAADQRGNAAKNELAIELAVLQIWYKRWWAWGLYTLVLSGVIFAFYRFQIRRKLEQQEAVRLKELDSVKTKLYTNITHEFRTPLTVISGMAEQIKEGQSSNEEKAKIITRNSQNLLNLVNQMLDLSKLESGKMTMNMVSGDVVAYIKYILESFHALAASKNIRIHFLPELDILSINFDREKLRNIVVNLLSNALKFTDRDGDIYVNLNQENNQLFLKVKDTGIGISKEKLPHIFDRFYQVDDTHTREGEGTGIGLALVKELVKLMDGEITVKSELGRGTEFLVCLPVSLGAPLAPEGESIRHHENQEIEFLPNKLPTSVLPPAGGVSPLGARGARRENTSLAKLLIIEDNADVRSYIQTLLEKDYNIQMAPDGEIGIETAFETIPDIIISDVMMPKKDGFEVVQTLKNDERTSHIPIILLTAKADFQSKLEGLKYGADVYLKKPFNQSELEIRLLKLLELRRVLQSKYSRFGVQQLETTVSVSTALNKEEAFLQRFYNIVEKNMSNPEFDMTRLSRKLNMSRSQVYRKVKALTDKSPAVLIRSIRLEKGKKLLATTDLTASEIAYEVGFSSLNYFSDAFFEEFGIRPSATRN